MSKVSVLNRTCNAKLEDKDFFNTKLHKILQILRDIQAGVSLSEQKTFFSPQPSFVSINVTNNIFKEGIKWKSFKNKSGSESQRNALKIFIAIWQFLK